MKKLEECKAYFEDVFMDMLDSYEESKRFEMLEETLSFIYGDEYKWIEANWKHECAQKYFSAKYKGVTV